MANPNITITGETPVAVPNPSLEPAFCARWPVLFAPLQTEAYSRVKEGRSCVLVAPTSSGKTLAVAAPLFEARRPAVFVLPYRALILDQTQELLEIGSTFGLTPDNFGVIQGGSTTREMADALTRDYLLITPDKLVSLFISGRDGNAAALGILQKYDFVFDEIHVFNALMRTSLQYFLRSVMHWQEFRRGKSGFYFLSATFPEEIWRMLRSELGLSDADRIEGVSFTGNIELMIRPAKEADVTSIEIEISALGIETNLVGIFNSAYRAWQIADLIDGLLFIGQDKMRETQRRRNFDQFKEEPENWALIGSPAIEAGVDFVAKNVVIEESHQDSSMQRFGRAGRSGRDAFVLMYSDTLYQMYKKGSLKAHYSRAEFLELLRTSIPRREPSTLLSGLAAYSYYKFWQKPDEFPMESEHRALCGRLEGKGVSNFLAFRSLTPYTEYETGERISYKTLFRKDLPIRSRKVRGAPRPEKYFYTPNRKSPVTGTVKQIACTEPVGQSKVILAEVSFAELETHWVLLMLKLATGVNDQDDNIRLLVPDGGVLGRNADGSFGQVLVSFYDGDD